MHQRPTHEFFCNNCGKRFKTKVSRSRFCGTTCGNFFYATIIKNRRKYFIDYYHTIAKKDPKKLAKRREYARAYMAKRRKGKKQ